MIEKRKRLVTASEQSSNCPEIQTKVVMCILVIAVEYDMLMRCSPRRQEPRISVIAT